MTETDMIRTSEEVTDTSIKAAYREFEARCDRLRALDKAYRTGQVGEAVEYPVNKCRYISDTKTAYTCAIPPSYDTDEGDANAEAIVELYRDEVKEQTDQAITGLCSRFGRAFELVYLVERDGRLVPDSEAVSPLDAFVAYDGALKPDSVFGAVHYVRERENGTQIHFLDVYDRAERTTWAQGESGKGWSKGESVPHGFDRVPLIEYRNNGEAFGDFEAVMPIQAALNHVMSDRVIDKDKFAEAYLVSKGFWFGDTAEEVDESITRLKGQKVIGLPKDADLSFLTKAMDESSVQVLVDDLTSELHTISQIPDLSDESFAANASGVAMRYKLLGLSNLCEAFLVQHRKGFVRRCKLFSVALFGRKDAVDVSRMRCVFRFNLPVDEAYEAQALQQYMAMGVLSRRTAMQSCPYVEDVAQEEERIASEREDEDAMMARAGDDLIQARALAELDDGQGPARRPQGGRAVPGPGQGPGAEAGEVPDKVH